jgi:hypothetical protein
MSGSDFVAFFLRTPPHVFRSKTSKMQDVTHIAKDRLLVKLHYLTDIT